MILTETMFWFDQYLFFSCLQQHQPRVWLCFVINPPPSGYPTPYHKWSDQQLDSSASHPPFMSTTLSSTPAFKHDIPTFCLSSPTTGLQNHVLNQIDHRLMVSWISIKIQQIYRKVYVLEVLNSNAPTPESMPVSLSYPLMTLLS